MRALIILSLLIPLILSAISCDDSKRKEAKEKRMTQGDFFKSPEDAVGLDSFKNELGDSQTDFLQSFSSDPIAWQKWDNTLIAKAKSAQSPIMALVGSAEGGLSRRLGIEISENAKLRKVLTDQSLCTVIDTLAHPEIKLLTFHLSNELKRATLFPTLIWMSHRGDPIAWIPIGELSGRELEVVVEHSVATVNDIWTDHSEYAVENSLTDNQARQKRIDPQTQAESESEFEFEEKTERDEVFRRSTRQLSSLYNFGERDLDRIGGLIPTESIALLAMGSQSGLLNDQTRANCQKAATEVTTALIQEALKDHLDKAYFFARQSENWSLPAFSKNALSQAKVAHTLITVGSIFEEQSFIDEGLATLANVEGKWLAQSLSSRSPTDAPEECGKFLWGLPTLENLLSEKELPLALSAFSIKPNGNIPAVADPLGTHYKLNTLRRRVPIAALAQKFRRSVDEVESSLNVISAKLLKHRESITKYDTERAFCLGDFASILKAKITGSIVTADPARLQSASALADQMIKEFYHAENGWARLPLERGFISARCGDYCSAGTTFMHLYFATLDDKWLTLSQSTLDEAITKLKSPNGLLAEVPAEKRIIQIRQHNSTMVFGNSSLGMLDQLLSRIWAITGEEKYAKLLEKQHLVIAPLALKSSVTHTDYISSCALGTHPLLAILHGDPNSQNGRALLNSLNSQKHLPFISIRRAKADDPQPAPPVPETSESVTIIRNAKVLGTATTGPALDQLLRKIISQK